VRFIVHGWATFLPCLVFTGVFIFDLWANNCQTHHVTLTFDLGGYGACPWTVVWIFVLRLCTKFVVHRPSRSEDIAHLQCEAVSINRPGDLAFDLLNS